MSQMKDLDARQELLVITMEECGELIQACSKALRRGELYAHSDSETELKQEISDVYAMIELLQDWDVISWTEIEQGVERKRNKLKRWSKLIDPHPPKSEEKEKNFPSNSVTWRQALGDTNTVDMTPLSEQEEREWDRIYQIQESQKNAKESQ
tara:strand:+ start:1594 stop:2049 length:456 start_codon:yes stop_codon:yes gene_type:complete